MNEIHVKRRETENERPVSLSQSHTDRQFFADSDAFN